MGAPARPAGTGRARPDASGAAWTASRSAHPTSVLACATPVESAINAAWLQVEQDLAAAEGIGFIDPTPWVCPSSPCPAVFGNLLVYRDAGHLTATFAAALTDRLEQAVLADLAEVRDLSRRRPLPQ